VNAYQELQSSGIHWPDRSLAEAYQPVQPAPRQPEPRCGPAIVEPRQMVEFAAQNEGFLDELRKHYVFPADSSVRDFLTVHRTVPQILLEAAPQLIRCFGATAVFTLRAPIDEGGSRTLYAVAMWPGALRDVRDALERFDREWWIARAGRAAGYLEFTYELV